MRTIASRLIRRVVGDANVGCLDYHRYPHWRDSWGGPFNGQAKRRELFDAIVDELGPKAIIETGTFRGTTALYFCSTGLPVYTVEGLARNFGFARSQLRGRKNVTILNSDSRNGLRDILAGPLARRLHEPLFFYLDAHWNADLPLAEELNIILSVCARPIIMVDDFEVPSDEGYGFDNYGGANVLNYDYISSHIQKYELKCLYPAAPSAAETGAKRGSVILCNEADAEKLLMTGSVLSS